MNTEKTPVNCCFHGARYYDPQLSRWHCPDPLSESSTSLSPYTYVANNPVNLVDPNGMLYAKPSDWEREQAREGAVYSEAWWKLAGMMGRPEFWTAVPTFEDQYMWIEGPEGGAYVRRTDISTYYGAEAQAYYLSTLDKYNRYNVEYYGVDKYGSTDILIEDLVGGGATLYKMAFWQITGYKYNPLYVLDGYLAFGLFDEAKAFVTSHSEQLIIPLTSIALGMAKEVTFSKEFNTWMGKDFKIRSQNWGGNERTGGKFKFAKKLGRAFKIGGTVADVYGFMSL